MFHGGNNEDICSKIYLASFSDKSQKDLAQLLTPVKEGIVHYASEDTGKLTILKESMEKNLNAQETRNRIMTNSGKMAALIAKMGLNFIPKLMGMAAPLPPKGK